MMEESLTIEAELCKPRHRRRLGRSLASGRDTCLLANRGETLLGYAIVSEALIVELRVFPSGRTAEIAPALVEAALEIWPALQFRAESDDSTSIRLARELGFRLCGKRGDVLYFLRSSTFA